MIKRVSEKNEPIILIIVPYEKSTVQLTGTGEVIHIGKEPKVFVLDKLFALERNQIVGKGFFFRSFFVFTMNGVDTGICSSLCKVKRFQRSDGTDPIWGYLPRGFIMLAVVERLSVYWYYHIISMTANTRRYHNGGLMLV